MFRYRALALESDWDEFGYTDASDIEIESEILELGDEYEAAEPEAPQGESLSARAATTPSRNTAAPAGPDSLRRSSESKGSGQNAASPLAAAQPKTAPTKAVSGQEFRKQAQAPGAAPPAGPLGARAGGKGSPKGREARPKVLATPEAGSPQAVPPRKSPGKEQAAAKEAKPRAALAQTPKAARQKTAGTPKPVTRKPAVNGTAKAAKGMALSGPKPPVPKTGAKKTAPALKSPDKASTPARKAPPAGKAATASRRATVRTDAPSPAKKASAKTAKVAARASTKPGKVTAKAPGAGTKPKKTSTQKADSNRTPHARRGR